MRVAVLGGTGLVGRQVVDLLADRGHEPRAVARSTGVDLATGRGLSAALDGVEAVVDASNVTSWRRATAVRFFTAVARHVQSAARAAGVRHLVVLSIVGVDRVPRFGYYEAKLAQERIALTGALPASVLRATQFHEFPGQVLARSRRGPVAFVPRMRVQPVASRSVAATLADLSTGEAARQVQEVAGPEQHDLPDLARQWLRHEGQRVAVLAARLPGAAGRAQVGGALIPGPDALVTGPTFEEWLATRPAGRDAS